MVLPDGAFEENVYAFALAKNQVEKYCNQCLTSMAELKKCSACGRLFYCSRECQRTDWKLHKTECKSIKEHNEVANDSVRLVMRIVGLLNQNEIGEVDGDHIPNGFRSIQTLQDHSNEMDSESDQFAQEFVNYALPPHPHIELIKNIFKKVSINSFSLSNSTGNNIGIALCIKLSAANHSCKPLTRVCYRNRTAFLVPVSDRIPTTLSGAHHSYIDELMPMKLRKETLKKKYKFDCNCEGCRDEERNAKMEAFTCGICVNGWMKNVEDSTCEVCGWKMSRDHYEICRAAEEAGYAARLRLENDSIPMAAKKNFCEKLMELFEDTLHRYNVHRIPVLRAMFFYALASSDIPSAARTGVKLLSIMLEYQSATDPAILFQKYQLAQLFCAAGSKSEALKILSDVKDPLEKIFTADSTIVRNVYCMIVKVRSLP